jgi:hypothetical protein
MIKIILLVNNMLLISGIEEIPSELGEPDCKLVKPYLIKSPQIEGLSKVLEPFLIGVTEQDSFMISSDKILTLSEPTTTLLEKYQTFTKE